MRLENFGSFAFARGCLVFRAKANVPKCAVGYVGIFGLFLHCRSILALRRVSGNVLQIGDGRAF
jgi:hypothetical protein